MKTRTCLILLLLVSLSQAAPIGTGFTYQGELKQLGANANITTRFTTSVMMGGAAELLAVGTAVVVEPEGQ